VKDIVYHVKINDLQQLKAHMRDIVATVTSIVLQITWNEVEYRLDICCATKGTHIKIYWEIDILKKNFDIFTF
jgi:hypothetical protein